MIQASTPAAASARMIATAAMPTCCSSDANVTLAGWAITITQLTSATGAKAVSSGPLLASTWIALVCAVCTRACTCWLVSQPLRCGARTEAPLVSTTARSSWLPRACARSSVVSSRMDGDTSSTPRLPSANCSGTPTTTPPLEPGCVSMVVPPTWPELMICCSRACTCGVSLGAAGPLLATALPVASRTVMDCQSGLARSEEHTSELQSQSISYAVFC